MIEAIGLTSLPSRGMRPAVDDLTFEARPGRVTALLGPPGAGKSTVLRLLLQIEAGRGVALFDGRPLHRMPCPAQEVGVLLGDVPGHPARTARGHLRMLAAAVGVPSERADDLLEVVGLGTLATEPVGSFSLGMDRRLGMAAALLGDPHTLVLDEPAQGLSPRDAGWLHRLLRGFAAQGGAVLTTLREPGEAVRLADRVVSLHEGRLLADQDAADFARTRLRPRVAVASPHAERLAVLLRQEARSAPPGDSFSPPGRSVGSAEPAEPAEPMEVVAESGTRLAVYGSTCAAVGETAYRNGILVHRLAEETGAGEPPGQAPPAQSSPVPGQSSGSRTTPSAGTARKERGPRLHAVGRPGPVAPVRYEIRRLTGVRTPWCIAGCALALALVGSIGLALVGPDRLRDDALLRSLAGWPVSLLFPLPPAAAAAGLLGALAYGQEFRYPALAPAHTAVPRKLGLLLAKGLVSAAVSVLLCLATFALNAATVLLLFGADAFGPNPGVRGPAEALAGCAVLAVGCGWAGLLAAGAARSTSVGLAAVLAVPLVVVPLARHLFPGADGTVLEGLSDRVEHALLAPWPSGADGWVPVAVRLVSQPVGQALAMSLCVLLAAYALLGLRGRTR
ncbi:ATP-binding cassette domain-containing protein [Streptomyces sp. TR02-1]|uniref:ABC transporter ATP-binding protein n=1 Tax=Streptomyces sp. TR02-1 TaxID=3385977 RepID=UPI0039A1CDF1